MARIQSPAVRTHIIIVPKPRFRLKPVNRLQFGQWFICMLRAPALRRRIRPGSLRTAYWKPRLKRSFTTSYAMESIHINPANGAVLYSSDRASEPRSPSPSWTAVFVSQFQWWKTRVSGATIVKHASVFFGQHDASTRMVSRSNRRVQWTLLSTM